MLTADLVNFLVHFVPYSNSEIQANEGSTILHLNSLDYMASLIGTALEENTGDSNANNWML